MKFSSIFISLLFISGCDYQVNSRFVEGAAGKAGQQTSIRRDTQGNMLGYYEYLPLDFDSSSKNKYSIIFYWNGANAISGDGKKKLSRLLSQGLPKYIKEGKHYPAIIISGQMKRNDWKKIDIHPFVKYILKRYSKKIDLNKIYMTGFSAGGGLTIRYAIENPEILAAIVPVSPASKIKNFKDPSRLLNTNTWFFHNKGDEKINYNLSVEWHDYLKDKGADHKLTIYDVDGHYAWYQAYSNNKLWTWLLTKSRH